MRWREGALGDPGFLRSLEDDGVAAAFVPSALATLDRRAELVDDDNEDHRHSGQRMRRAWALLRAAAFVVLSVGTRVTPAPPVSGPRLLEREKVMRTLAALVFPGFETLDYFGPIEILGGFGKETEIITVAKGRDPVPSCHGQRIVIDRMMSETSDYDLLLIPGGDAALIEAKDEECLDWIREASAKAEKVMAVCTGSVLLAMTGVLDGRRATTNKRDFMGTVHLAANVQWVKEARWVEDGKFFTSSGVSAGMDMALAVMANLYGMEMAERLALGCEYEWHKDAGRDPFAKSAGLI